MQKDSVKGTLIVASVLCICCSIVVSAAAVILKPRQEINKVLDVKKNLLLASGLIQNPKATKEEILEAYQRIQPMVVNLETGEEDTSVLAENYSQREAAKKPDTSVAIPSDKDFANIKKRAKLATIYKVVNEDIVEMLIFPVHGKGLWSTMYGFLALSSDLSEIRGLGFYEHGETPGLGGEIDNPKWKKQWTGKNAFAEGSLEPKIRVIKGAVNPNGANANFEIDGLSGATITANGVTNTVHYWLGEHGFGPYLAKYQQQLTSQGGETDESN